MMLPADARGNKYIRFHTKYIRYNEKNVKELFFSSARVLAIKKKEVYLQRKNGKAGYFTFGEARDFINGVTPHFIYK